MELFNQFRNHRKEYAHRSYKMKKENNGEGKLAAAQFTDSNHSPLI